MPRAMSRPTLPVDTTWTPSAMLAPSLRRMIEPLPYSFSMVATASSIALLLFLGSSMTVLGLGRGCRGALAEKSLTGNLFSFQLLLLAAVFAAGCESSDTRGTDRE